MLCNKNYVCRGRIFKESEFKGRLNKDFSFSVLEEARNFLDLSWLFALPQRYSVRFKLIKEQNCKKNPKTNTSQEQIWHLKRSVTNSRSKVCYLPSPAILTSMRTLAANPVHLLPSGRLSWNTNECRWLCILKKSTTLYEHWRKLLREFVVCHGL